MLGAFAPVTSGDRRLPGALAAQFASGWPQRVTRLPSATQVAPRRQQTVNIIRQAHGHAEASQSDIGDTAQIPMLVPRETLEAPGPVKWLREVRTLQGVDSEAEQREALALARNSK